MKAQTYYVKQLFDMEYVFILASQDWCNLYLFSLNIESLRCGTYFSASIYKMLSQISNFKTRPRILLFAQQYTKYVQGLSDPDGEGAIAFPKFGRSGNPIQTRGQIMPINILLTPSPLPRIFRPSYGPVCSRTTCVAQWIQVFKTRRKLNCLDMMI